MHLRHATVLIAILVYSGIGLTGAAPAPAALLQDLIANYGTPAGELPAGGVIFDNFAAVQTGPLSTNYIPLIQVNASNPGDTILRFEPLAGESSILSAAGAYGDLLISFRVRAPQNPITAVSLSYDASAPQGILTQVVETVASGSMIKQMQVDNFSGSYAWLDLGGAYQELEIIKDVAVLGGTGPASVAWIEQRFVPEPAALGLLGLGALLLIRRRPARYLRLTAAGVVCLAVMLLSAIPWQASAAPLSSSLIVPSPSGHFTFSNFSLAPTVSGPALAGDIDVSPLTINGEDGLRFAGFSAAYGSSGSVMLQIEYDVAVNAPYAIDAAYMRFNGAWTGTGQASGIKTLFSGTEQVGQLMVHNSTTAQALSAQSPLPLAYTSIHVVDNIILQAGESGTATLSFIDQTFRVVPEPATALLLSGGLLLIRSRRRCQ